MSKILQLRRGTTSAHADFTGKVGEVTVDTDKDTLVVHDGSKAGGYPLQRSDQKISSAANADTATKLKTARTIGGVNFDGSANLVWYASCSTAAGTAAKTVSVSNFKLATGAMVIVRFTVTNTASNATLNVSNTGAKNIRYRNANISAGYLAANRTYLFVYDGSYYQLIGDVDTNTTYSVASEDEAKAGTNNSKMMTPLRVKQAMDASSSLPTGSVIWYAGTSAPSGFLICNGSDVSRSTYANLFSVIGTKYGDGNGSSTFTLPNGDERFIEGTTDASKVGQYVEAGLPNITGTYEAQELYWWESTPTATGCFWLCDSSATIGASRGSDVDMSGIGFDANRSNPIFGRSTTVQPLALTLLPCIKT